MNRLLPSGAEAAVQNRSPFTDATAAGTVEMRNRNECFPVAIGLAALLIGGAVPPANSEPAEPADAIASDIIATRRSAPVAGAFSASPVADAPRLGLITPEYPEMPAAWRYNPYTAGLGPCPQREPGDPPCSDTVVPSYPSSGGAVRF